MSEFLQILTLANVFVVLGYVIKLERRIVKIETICNMRSCDAHNDKK